MHFVPAGPETGQSVTMAVAPLSLNLVTTFAAEAGVASRPTLSTATPKAPHRSFDMMTPPLGRRPAPPPVRVITRESRSAADLIPVLDDLRRKITDDHGASTRSVASPPQSVLRMDSAVMAK